MSGGVRDGCVCSLGSSGRRADVKRGVELGEGDVNVGCGRLIDRNIRRIDNEGTVGFLGVGAGFEIARGRIVGLHVSREDMSFTSSCAILWRALSAVKERG